MEMTPNPFSVKSSSREWLRDLTDAVRFWEPQRLAYNLVLMLFAAIWLIATWPHFRPAFTLPSFLLLGVLALLANVCYSATYFVDIPIQRSALGSIWRKRRWVLWLLGHNPGGCFGELLDCG